MLPAFRNGSFPSGSAMFANAYLIDSLYHQDLPAAQAYATLAGSVLDRFEADPSTYPPDWVMMHNGNDYLVCLAGTTKIAQWLAHVGSAFFPTIDTTTGHFSVGSFYVGLSLVEPAIMARLGTLTGKTIRLAGHSYGGAAAYILALHLMLSPNPPARVEVQTFGEPRSQGGTQNTALPAIHDRITTREDPVQFTPPSVSMLMGSSKIVSIIKLIGDGSWRHEGTHWNFSPLGIIQPDPVTILFFEEPFLLFELGVTKGAEHSVDASYLPRSIERWSSDGLNPEYSALLPKCAEWFGQPFVPPAQVGPAITPSQQNTAWFLNPAGPIDSLNQRYWQVASSVANITPTGGTTLSQMKGTFLFNFGTGGFSESLHAVNNTTLTYADMRAKMLALLPFRCALSRLAITNVKNPLVPFGIRVEDELVSRDAFNSIVPAGAAGNGFVVPVSTNEIFGQNIRQGNACQLKWCGLQSRQQAYTYIHAVALAATDNTLNDSNAVEMLKYAEMSSGYFSALAQYAHQIRLQGLGFRYLDSPWDTPTGPGPNAFPTSVAYNVAGSYYEFTMPSAPLAPFARYVLRGFKNMNFLNGRHPGIAIGGTQIRILERARQVVWDGTGTLVPEAWGYFTPNETLPPDLTQRFGVQHIAIVGKKIGRPFGGQRGRQSARPT